ncbi:MAG TPA: cytochrome ubiquinol oxidase subunit I [Candidatus Baltobacteraceae bacterium]|nr:cytochrome ubiquinol oxidase subunit I [Candidatus Baltobacteraceae bacterium]
MEGALIADRIQFAFTVMFHYLFPIGTMGIGPFIAWYTVKGVRTHDEQAIAIARFWAKIFTINFAIGVVTGIPMEFQFGTNWAQFSARAGSVVGQTLGMEGVYAFFLESVFLGVFLYGQRRVSPRFYALSAVAVWAGSWLSGFFIVATDAWMQHPVGYAIGKNGVIELRSIGAVLLSPFAWWQYAHVMTGALLAGAFAVAGVGAYYLLGRREVEFAQRLVRAGVIAGLCASIIAVFPTGDRNGAYVTRDQPAKLAAMEGLFASQHGAPLAVLGMPDTQHDTLIDPLYVPDVLSFLTYGNFRANVNGLTSYSKNLRPPVELTYYAYHVMVGLGTIFAAIMALAVLLLMLRRLYESRWLLWVLMLAMPFPYIANEAGWMVTEVGRQPWIVYGLMRTADAASPSVVAGETIFTTIGFAGMYFLLGLVFLLLILREIALGPSHEHVPGQAGATA